MISRLCLSTLNSRGVEDGAQVEVTDSAQVLDHPSGASQSRHSLADNNADMMKMAEFVLETYEREIVSLEGSLMEMEENLDTAR